uniref:Utp12 domain-containing protein n=1 Tax=Echinostoma caproni TaxID=27848 RepID=A0A183AZ24_9TREM
LATLNWKVEPQSSSADQTTDETTSVANKSLPSKASAFVLAPGDRHVIIGFESGHLVLFDVSSKTIRQSINNAHEGAVRGLALTGDKKGFVSGGSDKQVAFYNFDLSVPEFGPPTLCLNESRSKETAADQITCLSVSPNNRLLVLGLVNFHVDVYFADSFKGHDGSITGISAVATNAAFLARSSAHQTANNATKRGKKGKSQAMELDEDDLDDEFEDLCGGVIASCGRDFSVRIWTESEELLILEEQEQLAREAAEDEELVRSEAVIPGAVPTEASETGLLGRPTPNTRDAADMLMEAMDIYDQEIIKQQQAARGKQVAPPHPLMLARGTDSPERFLLSSLAALRAPSTRLGGGGAGLEHALGAITTEHAKRLLPRLADWLSKGWEVELVGRAIRHLVTLHFGLIVTCSEMREVLHQSREARLNTMGQVKSLIGTNLAGLNYLKKKIEDNNQATLFEELLGERDRRIRKQKAKRNKLALLIPG